MSRTERKMEIVPANGLRNFLAFCRLPRLLYKDRPGFAPPLDAERWTLFAAKLNPHFKLVQSQAWLARKNGKLAGRIFAQIYDEAHAPLGASRAQFGCLDAIDDDEVVAGLTRAAEDWLRQRGAALVHGPFSPSVNSETGLLVQGFEAAPMVFMPWNPAYLGGSLERQGYTKARDLISYRYDAGEKDRQARPSILERPEWRERLKIRTLDLKNIGKEAADHRRYLQRCLERKLGFCAIYARRVHVERRRAQNGDAARRRVHDRARRRAAGVRRHFAEPA